MKLRAAVLVSALFAAVPVLTVEPRVSEAQGSIPSGPQAARAEAKRLFGEGEDAYRRGDFDKAVDAWQKAYELSREPVIFENIANAYERLGKPREAKDALDKWRQVAPSDEHEILDQRLRNLAARIAKLDEEERERAKAKEKDPSENKEIPPKPVEETEDSGGGLSVPGLVVGGVGAGLVVAGVILDIVAGTGRPDEAEVCRTSGEGQICSETAKDDIDSTNTMAIVGDVLWITGAAAVAAGVIIVIVDQPSEEKPAAPAVSVVPVISPMFAGVVVGGTF